MRGFSGNLFMVATRRDNLTDVEINIDIKQRKKFSPCQARRFM